MRQACEDVHRLYVKPASCVSPFRYSPRRVRVCHHSAPTRRRWSSSRAFSHNQPELRPRGTQTRKAKILPPVSFRIISLTHALLCAFSHTAIAGQSASRRTSQTAYEVRTRQQTHRIEVQTVKENRAPTDRCAPCCALFRRQRAAPEPASSCAAASRSLPEAR